MNKLTIQVTLNDSGSLTATCTELNCSVNGEGLHEVLGKLEEEIDSCIFEKYRDKSSEAEVFVQQLYGEEGWEDWIEDKEYFDYQKKLEAAFVKAYPKAASYKFLNSVIPYISWDGGDNYAEDIARQKAAHDGLIAEGGQNKDWIEFVRWMAVVDIGFMSTESFTVLGRQSISQQEEYQKWIDLGLPVQPLAAIVKEVNRIKKN